MNFSRDMKSLKNRRKGKAGFTMSELLIVVAIVIVLFAVAVLSLVTIQKNLRQKELDSKAEIPVSYTHLESSCCIHFLE